MLGGAGICIYWATNLFSLYPIWIDVILNGFKSIQTQVITAHIRRTSAKKARMSRRISSDSYKSPQGTTDELLGFSPTRPL